jgi:hypothetical protein
MSSRARSTQSRARRMRKYLFALGAMLGVLATAPAAQAYSCGALADNFNRADSTDLGPNWTEQAGNLSIAGNQATQPGVTEGLMTFNGTPSASQACVDVTGPASDNQYAGFVLNYATVSDNRFVKVQDNSGDGTYDRVFAYVGNNSGAQMVNTAITTPFTSARLHISEAGGVVTLDIDADNDGLVDQAIPIDFGSAAATGTRIGLVAYSGARLDNFTVIPDPSPPDSSPPPVTHSGTTPVVDRTKPTLGGLTFSSTVFAAAKSGASTAKAKKATIGTKVSFSLSEASSVKFTVQRKTKGRKVGHKCKTKTHSNRRKKACTLYKSVKGSFSVAGKVGKNSFTFRGRIGGKALKPGSYRLNGTATDLAKNASVPKQKGFKIVK